MIKALLAKKLGMSQVFDTHGRMIPVTKVQVEPNVVIQIKTTEKDGYKAVQIGSGVTKKPTKPLIGHSKKSGVEFTPHRIAEVGFDSDVKSGDSISVDQVLRKGVLVDVIGTSKGKGFAGGMKRWGFHGGPKTHGQSDRARAPGSIGAGTTPGRVLKGQKMAGHMGNARVTVIGLEVMEINKETGEILIKGSVPGSIDSSLLLKKSSKKKKGYVEVEIPTAPVVAGEKEETPTETAVESTSEGETIAPPTESETVEKEG